MNEDDPKNHRPHDHLESMEFHPVLIRENVIPETFGLLLLQSSARCATSARSSRVSLGMASLISCNVLMAEG